MGEKCVYFGNWHILNQPKNKMKLNEKTMKVEGSLILNYTEKDDLLHALWIALERAERKVANFKQEDSKRWTLTMIRQTIVYKALIEKIKNI